MAQNVVLMPARDQAACPPGRDRNEASSLSQMVANTFVEAANFGDSAVAHRLFLALLKLVRQDL